MPTVKIVQRKLGAHHASGRYVHGKKQSIIEIDPRQKPLSELDTLIHESLHHCCPYLDEETVTKAGTDIAKIVWEFGFRKVKQ